MLLQILDPQLDQEHQLQLLVPFSATFSVIVRRRDYCTAIRIVRIRLLLCIRKNLFRLCLNYYL
jgi:hypothetical protein